MTQTLTDPTRQDVARMYFPWEYKTIDTHQGELVSAGHCLRFGLDIDGREWAAHMRLQVKWLTGTVVGR